MIKYYKQFQFNICRGFLKKIFQKELKVQDIESLNMLLQSSVTIDIDLYK